MWRAALAGFFYAWAALQARMPERPSRGRTVESRKQRGDFFANGLEPPPHGRGRVFTVPKIGPVGTGAHLRAGIRGGHCGRVPLAIAARPPRAGAARWPQLGAAHGCGWPPFRGKLWILKSQRYSKRICRPESGFRTVCTGLLVPGGASGPCFRYSENPHAHPRSRHPPRLWEPAGGWSKEEGK